jgi:hypothetical protein
MTKTCNKRAHRRKKKIQANSMPTSTPQYATKKALRVSKLPNNSPKRLNKRRTKPKRKRPPANSMPVAAPKQAHIPAPPPTLQDLQRIWYAKLQASGFNDLERFIGHDYMPADLLHGPSLRNAADMYSPEKLHYYRQWSCYLAHNADVLTVRDRIVALNYAEGLTYREISALLKAHRPALKDCSIAQVHYTVKRLRAYVVQFNKADARGLDFAADIGD